MIAAATALGLVLVLRLSHLRLTSRNHQLRQERLTLVA